jgi:hypothetical protein
MNTRQFAIIFMMGLTACNGIAGTPTLTGREAPGVDDAVILPVETLTGTPIFENPTQPSPDQPVSNDPGEQPVKGEPADYAPKPGDDGLTRGPAYIDRMELLMLESYPPQPVLVLAGSLPDACHALRVVVNPPDADGSIKIQVYSVVDPDKVCAQVLSGFEQSIPLSPIPAGKYTVMVNGKNAGGFEMP